MKIYTIIGGVNGVGKTSLIGVLSAICDEFGVIIDTTKLDGNKLKERIDQSLEMGINFTQETTLSGSRTLKTIKKAIDRNYYIRLYYIGVNSAEESIKRIKNRVEKGGHSIPDDDVIRRYGKRFDDLLTILPYCNEVYFYDNENGFVEAAEYRNGKLMIKCDDVPEWLGELKKLL